MNRILNVYFHNVLAGQLVQHQSGQLSFSYNSTYIAQSNPALSLSLPLQNASYQSRAANAFFAGLLPDDHVSQRLAQYLGISERNAFALLEVIGGECAGAVSLCPTDNQPLDGIREASAFGQAFVKGIFQHATVMHSTFGFLMQI